MSFQSLGLSPKITQALKQKGYISPTDIQKKLITAMLNRDDILASSHTGTGKTAGFVLPILQMLLDKKRESITPLRALILVPTRELAKQVGEQAKVYANYCDIEILTIYGGQNLTSQTKRLKEGKIELLIATPGRVIEHIERKNIDLRSIEHFILDEADTMLDMGFIQEISRVIQSLKDNRQNILISATITSAIKELSRELLHKPKYIEVASMGSIADTIELKLHPVTSEKKLELLSYLIGSRNYPKVLLFVRKKEEADIVAKELVTSGLKTAVIHGGKKSAARSRALREFKNGDIRVLVATDIAARGLDIKELDIVINYNIPHVTQDFIHRTGRTGRAGKKGLAITLSTAEESIALKAVERMLGRAIPTEIITGYEPQSNVKIKGARKNPNAKAPKTAGAFGNKKRNTTTNKKRKTTKRDAYKSQSTPSNKNAKKSNRSGGR